MRTIILLMLIGLVRPGVFSQDETTSEWQIMPGIGVVKFFPGKVMRELNYICLPTYPPIMAPSYTEHKYSGTGVNFNARCFSDDIKPLALTFGAGVTRYYRPNETAYALSAASQEGVGAVLGHRDFTAFPISLGIQAVFPFASRERLMMFAGAEGNLVLISADLDMDQQAKAGFTVLGGFAVKFFECGVRYTSFSDINNLGVHCGLRLKSFGI